MTDIIKDMDETEIARLIARDEAISLFANIEETHDLKVSCISDFLVRGYRCKVDTDCKNCKRGKKFPDGSFSCRILDSYTNLVNSVDLLVDLTEEYVYDLLRGK